MYGRKTYKPILINLCPCLFGSFCSKPLDLVGDGGGLQTPSICLRIGSTPEYGLCGRENDHKPYRIWW